MKQVVILVFAAFALAGCGSLSGTGEHKCYADMQATKEARGEPNNITRYDSETYHHHQYQYYGLIVSFTWFDTHGDCTVATYQY